MIRAFMLYAALLAVAGAAISAEIVVADLLLPLPSQQDLAEVQP